jgi:1-deoxy-D-xylulose-5-phosphate reductoisomerase
VATFLAGNCPFLSIADAVEAAMDACDVQPVESLEQLEEVDIRARAVAAKYLNR